MEEVILEINAEKKENGWYATVSDGVTGSDTDRGGDTLAGVVKAALDWAFVDYPDFDDSNMVEVLTDLVNKNEEFEIRLYARML